MTLILPPPPDRYNPTYMDEVNRALADADADNVKLLANVDLPHSLTVAKRVSFAFQTFGANDATPSVASGRNFATANTSATTITDFDDAKDGQEIVVWINDANTTIDFTSSGLKGNGGVDWSPASGDHMRCTYNGTDWLCEVFDNT